MSYNPRTRYAINTLTFEFKGAVETVRWTYERDEDGVYEIPVGVPSLIPPEYYRAMWAAIHAAAAVTPPVRV
jgi:hypothetical protein